MKLKIFIATLFISASMIAQYTVTIDAQILDKDSNAPVEFANVRFLDKNVGTVSNTQGKFFLKFDENLVGELGILQITALGYETRQITLRQLYVLLEKNNIIYVSPSSEVLSTGITRTINGKAVSTDKVSGKILSDAGPLPGAVIKVKGTFEEAVTNSEGEFEINAVSGDVLEISHLNAIPMEVSASPGGEMEIEMQIDGEVLEEVYVEGERRREPWETSIETAYGKRDFNKLGFSASQINSDQILPSYTTLDQILVKLTGVNFGGVPPDRRYFLNRSAGSSVSQNTLPVFVIDNVIYEQGPNQLLPAIDVQNISSITVLPSVAASVKYGTLGAGGAIIIRSKVLDFSERGGFGSNKAPSALVEGNNFNEVLPNYNAKRVVPDYLAQYSSIDNLNEAKRLYASQMKQKDTYGIPYYVHVSKVFTKWDKAFAAKVLTNIADIAPNNVRALKTMAYELEELGMMEEAKSAYQRIALLQPESAQSYRDLAYIYQETGEITKAFGLYKQILANETPGIDFTGIQKVAEHELQKLVKLNKPYLDYASLPNDLLDASFKRDIRVVLEWNDPSAEFEVQFVNPQKKYFTWYHDLFNNRKRMSDEAASGYAMEEFIIDDSDRGPWQINIRYLGDEKPSKNPAFMKYTIYKNYGMPQETKEVKVLKLYPFKDKVLLDRFNY